MAQLDIKYTIPEDAWGNFGCKVDITFTYDPSAQNGDGSFVATDASGTYQIIYANGGVTQTYQITGLAAVGQLGANDNRIFVGQQPYVSGSGITYLINDQMDSNDGTGQVNFYYDTQGAPAYKEDGSNINPATNVSEAAVDCFVTGTLIRTARGDIAVENLTLDDRVVTVSGIYRAIKWIGHKTIDGQVGLLSPSIWPVRILAGAFGEGRPRRDLCLSQGHPVLVAAEDDDDGCLVPVMCLINGTSIERAPVKTVTYWHLELEVHDILLAEGLPVESYLDQDDRQFFVERAKSASLGFDTTNERCRPVAIRGEIVEAERRRLDMVFAMQLVAACAWPSVDGADCRF